MAKKSFKEVYDSLPGRAETTTPKVEFINHIADLTKKTPFTVRQWIAGRQCPDALTQTVISKELGVPVEELFPVPVNA